MLPRPTARSAAHSVDSSWMDSADVSQTAPRAQTSSSCAKPPNKPKHAVPQKVSPKTLLYLNFFITEAVMILCYFLQVSQLHQAMWQNYQDTVYDHISVVKYGYSYKVNILKDALSLRTTSAFILDYLTSGLDYDDVRAELKTAQSLRAIDYDTILAPDGTIVANANTDRRGQTWNPGNIITLMKNNLQTGVVTKTVQVSYSDMFEVEDVPLIRYRATSLDAAMKKSHPKDILSSALVRFIVMPVYKNATVTFNSSDVIGYVVMGDSINGQADISTRITHEMGHYVGYYMQDSNNTVARQTGQHWIGVSHHAAVSKKGLNDAVSSLEYDPIGIANQNTLDSMLQHGGETVVGSKSVNGFLLGGCMIPDWSVPNGDNSQLQYQGVLVRGIDTTEQGLLSGATLTCVFYLAGVLLVDVLTVLLATFLFLTPLEKMGRLIRAGGKVDVRHLRSLAKRKHSILLVALLNVVPVVLTVVLLYQVLSYMEKAISERASREPGILTVMSRYKSDNMLSALDGLRTESALKALLATNATPELYNLSLPFLKAQQAYVQTEHLVLINATDLTVIQDVNGHHYDGMRWDPAGLATDVSKTCYKYSRFALTTFDNLLADHTPYYPEKLKATTPDSKLYPSTPGAIALMRYVAVPVYAGADGVGKCEGLLVMGYIIDGATALVELANDMYGQGYSAIYTYTPKGYKLAASALTLASGKVEVDVELPNKRLLEQVRNSGYMSYEIFTDYTTIRKQKFVVSGRCQPENFYVDTLGVGYDTQWSGAPADVGQNGTTNKCFVIMVRGLPYSSVEPVVKKATTWQYIGVAIQVAKVFAMTFICYKVFQPFQKIILKTTYVKTAPVPPPQPSSVTILGSHKLLQQPADCTTVNLTSSMGSTAVQSRQNLFSADVRRPTANATTIG